MPTHQPQLGRRCSWEAFSHKDQAPQQAGCSARKRERFLEPTGQGRERTGQQEPRVRPKRKGGPRGLVSVNQKES